MGLAWLRDENRAQAWREAAAARGVDPEAGSTSYQAALAGAEVRRRRHRPTGWWKTVDLWRDGDSVESVTRPAEVEAIRRIHRQARLIRDMPDASEEWIERALNEALETARRALRDAETLRELQARQRAPMVPDFELV